MSPCCLLILNLLKLLHPVPQVYLPLCCLFFFFYHTDSSLLFLLSLCIASPGELLLPVLKTKPDESLTFLDLVLALIHELNSAPVSINLVSVKLPSEYSSAKPE